MAAAAADAVTFFISIKHRYDGVSVVDFPLSLRERGRHTHSTRDLRPRSLYSLRVDSLGCARIGVMSVINLLFFAVARALA